MRERNALCNTRPGADAAMRITTLSPPRAANPPTPPAVPRTVSPLNPCVTRAHSGGRVEAVPLRQNRSTRDVLALLDRLNKSSEISLTRSAV